MLYLGADHRGFSLKEEIKKYLDENNIQHVDVGNLKYNKNDDYPDIAYFVSKEVVKNPKHRGVLVCGSGQGVAIAANKIAGVRATPVFSEQQAMLVREHNDANILALSSDELSLSKAKKILEAFLNAKFSNSKRHVRRLKKIRDLERDGGE